jgi:hypothetical protein
VYKGFQTVRGEWPLCDTTPLAIISLRLDGISPIGDAAVVVGNHLSPFYVESPYLFESVEYDLDRGIYKYDSAIRASTQRLLK